MRDMFAGCKELQQDFSSWDISKVNYTANMFKGCTKMSSKFYPKGYEA